MASSSNLVPIVDFSSEKSTVMHAIVKASEEFGFFKLTNHKIPEEIICDIEKQAMAFFSKPSSQKQQAIGSGYGIKAIGSNGDSGDVEYLLLQANPDFVCESAKSVSDNPTEFSTVVNNYTRAVRGLACEMLQLMAEALGCSDKLILSRLIGDNNNDSLLRINHYLSPSSSPSPLSLNVGFGEHTDPQLLTLLRSNDGDGFEICTEGGVWIPVPSDPAAFYVNVGDLLQAFTNDRFKSVKHRVVSNSSKRLSMIYFGTPPLKASISPLSELTVNQPPQYRSFTWEAYKKAVYEGCVSDPPRLFLFRY